MHRPFDEHWLVVAVRAGVVVRPRDARGVLVVAHGTGIDALVVELVDQTQRAQPAEAAAQVLVVAGGEYAATVLAEPPDGVGIGGREAFTDVDSH
jgi:hypothetical protein